MSNFTGSLHYRVGNEHDPSDPFGRSELQVAADDTVHLEQIARTGRRAWRARLSPAAAERLRAAVGAAPASLPPGPPPVAGATLRTLTLGDGVAARHIVVDWHAGAKLPGYGDAFAVLDAIVAQVLGHATTTWATVDVRPASRRAT